MRRALDGDPRTGQRRWTDRHFLFNLYQDAELGYAVTDHAAQGRTVHTGLAVITGTEDRQHVYVALTRGTDANHAYVFTASPKRADLVPGPARRPNWPGTTRSAPNGPAIPPRPPRPPPRARRSACYPLSWNETASSAPPPRPATRPSLTPITWPCCTPSGPPRPARPASSATGTCSRPPCRPATTPGPDPGTGGCGGPCTPPNSPAWTPPRSSPTRSPNGTSPAPATSRPSSTPASGTGPAPRSRSRRAVVRARPRHRRPRTPRLPHQIAALMDARKQRLGEHAAACAPPWAVSALGPVPEHPAARLDWQRRAASIAAWRELSGYHHPADPIGPEPAAAAPDLRAAWHEALAALGPAEGPTCAACRTGCCCTCATPTPSRPPGRRQYVGDELRQVRDAAWDTRLTSLRAAAEARAARLRGDHRQATRDQERAAQLSAPWSRPTGSARLYSPRS